MRGTLHPVRQEEDRIKTGKVLAASCVALVCFGIGIGWAVRIQRGRAGSLQSAAVPPPRAAGKLEVGMVFQPIFDLPIAEHEMRRKRLRLHTLDWTDPDRKTAHIPIERAMRLVVERGKL